MVDCRPFEQFASGHLRGSINVGLDGRFAEYAGDVLSPGQSVVLVAEPGHESEARIRLARIGFDQVVGALPDIAAVLTDHPELAERAPRLTASELDEWLRSRPRAAGGRRAQPGRVRRGHGRGRGQPAAAQPARPPRSARPGRPTVVYCAGGYRSAIAASLLRSRGFATVADVFGGYGAACGAIS